jgi:aldoxime dehydratase
MSDSSDAGIVAVSRSPGRMPPNWRPPVPAWSASFSNQHTPIVMAYFGTQLHGGNEQDLSDQIGRFFDSSQGPATVERAKFVDRAGARNFISAAYWTNPRDYDDWRNSSGFQSWWGDPARLSEGQGYFREIMTVPPDRFETIFSSGAIFGVAKSGTEVVGPIREHNYWGSMRDRIRCSENDPLTSGFSSSLNRVGVASTRGCRLQVEVPGNLAVIRSGQDWTECVGTELSEYTDAVRPALNVAMNFLRDHAEETGCCDMRFAEEIEVNGSPTKRTFGLGLFLTLENLENWAATHPAHLTIFSAFGKMIRRYGESLKLKLWHEVAVLPSTGHTFEYLNCHSETGLLPFFPSRKF